jgi:hypothetical protein
MPLTTGIALPDESPTVPVKIEIDTYMHCLNAFKAVTILMCNQPGIPGDDLLAFLPSWKVESRDVSGTEQSATVPDVELHDHLAKLEAEKAEFWYSLDTTSSETWKVFLAPQRLTRDTLHEFTPDWYKQSFSSLSFRSTEKFTHLILYGLPDGGIHRFAVY